MEVTLKAGEALELLYCIRSMSDVSRKFCHGSEGGHEVGMAIARTVGTSAILSFALSRVGIVTTLIALEKVE